MMTLGLAFVFVLKSEIFERASLSDGCSLRAHSSREGCFSAPETGGKTAESLSSQTAFISSREISTSSITIFASEIVFPIFEMLPLSKALSSSRLASLSTMIEP